MEADAKRVRVLKKMTKELGRGGGCGGFLNSPTEDCLPAYYITRLIVG